jgi:hypothetical protein
MRFGLSAEGVALVHSGRASSHRSYRSHKSYIPQPELSLTQITYKISFLS